MAAQVIFLGFSLGCGFAQSLTQLIVFRALQGVGGSGLYSLSMVILPELVPEELEKYMGGIVGLVLTGSGVLGPVLGGVLTDYASWRWIFRINGPIGVVSIAGFWFAWPKPEQLPTLQRRSWKQFDLIGSCLLIAAAVLVVFALQNAGHDSGQEGGSWGEAIFIAPLALGITSWIALITWGLFAETRLGERCALTFPVSLFRNRAYASGTISSLFMGFPYLLLIFSFPLRAQLVSRESPMMAGVMLLPMLGSTAIGTVIAGKLNGVHNRLCETMSAGSAFMILSCALLSTVEGPEDDGKALGFLVFAGLGFGLSTASATMIVSFEAPIKDYGKYRTLNVTSFSLTTGLSTCTGYTGSATHSWRQLRDCRVDRLRGRRDDVSSDRGPKPESACRSRRSGRGADSQSRIGGAEGLCRCLPERYGCGCRRISGSSCSGGRGMAARAVED